jgi:hypothetical protein
MKSTAAGFTGILHDLGRSRNRDALIKAKSVRSIVESAVTASS